jgi:hypothetical protein
VSAAESVLASRNSMDASASNGLHVEPGGRAKSDPATLPHNGHAPGGATRSTTAESELVPSSKNAVTRQVSSLVGFPTSHSPPVQLTGLTQVVENETMVHGALSARTSVQEVKSAVQMGDCVQATTMPTASPPISVKRARLTPIRYFVVLGTQNESTGLIDFEPHPRGGPSVRLSTSTVSGGPDTKRVA